jgi:ribosomal protein L21E
MKTLADKKRTDQTFDVGDKVFIKLQPYVQLSTVQRSNHKLSFRYFGPYGIIKKINPVAYEVKLPEASKIHPVFHVSQLRRILKSGTHASTQLPFQADVALAPVKILNTRWYSSPSGRREQVQVQWPPENPMYVTWEDKLQLQCQFPTALAWGQATSQGVGDVSTPTASREQEDNKPGLIQRSPRPRRIMQPNRKHIGPDWTR